MVHTDEARKEKPILSHFDNFRIFPFRMFLLHLCQITISFYKLDHTIGIYADSSFVAYFEFREGDAVNKGSEVDGVWYGR